MPGPCLVWPRLSEFSSVVLSCFTLSRATLHGWVSRQPYQKNRSNHCLRKFFIQCRVPGLLWINANGKNNNNKTACGIKEQTNKKQANKNSNKREAKQQQQKTKKKKKKKERNSVWNELCCSYSCLQSSQVRTCYPLSCGFSLVTHRTSALRLIRKTRHWIRHP